MHRIDSDGAAVALPTPGAVGATVGYFTEGDPGLGVEATVVSADWLNAVQEELRGVIVTGAGLSLDKTSQAQLLAAIRILRGINTRTALSSSTAQATTDHWVEIDSTSGNITYTLLTAVGNSGKVLIIKKTVAANQVIIDANSTETIDSELTRTLNGKNEIVAIVSDGTNWRVAYSSGAPNSFVAVADGNGHGSTNTKIRRFTTTVDSAGSGITYADSAGNGASFTINEDGLYQITYTDCNNSAAAAIGISINSAALTTSIDSISNATRLNRISTPGALLGGLVSAMVRLSKNDVIRAHTDGTTDATGNYVKFTITQVARG